ncbi:MAG: sugar ABC transporter substrate-binding protein [Suipraeoptans sp.]
MKKRFLSILLVSVLLVGLLSACSSGGGSGETSNGSDSGNDYVFRVGFINIDNADSACYPAMVEFEKYVESPEFAENIGVDSVEVLTADSAKDIEKQTTNVETMLTRGIDMLFLIGVDTEANTVAVEACNAEGIPVYMVGTEASGGDWKFVGFNEIELGKRQGEWCVDNLPENTKICYLEGTPGREAAVLRKQGFEEGIASRSDLEIISSQTAKFETAAAMQVTEDWIQTYADDIGCIVAADSKMIVGAVEGLKGANMNEQVITCGVVHLGEEDGYMVKDGDCSYSIFVYWPSIGTLCGEIAEKVYLGEDIEQETYIELQDMTPDNFEEIVNAI